MQSFVKRNLKTLLDDKSLCDVSIDIGRSNEEIKTFHCVGALIAVHSTHLKEKIFCISSDPKSQETIRRSSKSKIELIESKEEELSELDGDYTFGAEEIASIHSIVGLDDDDDDNDAFHRYKSNPIFEDISSTTFEYLRSLFYGLNPWISSANVIGIYDASIRYALEPLRSATLSYIQCISVEDYPSQFLSLLIDCQNYELYQMSNRLILKLPNHISQTFFTCIINDDYFESLSIAVLEMLLFQNSAFKDMPQEYLWIAVLKWAKARNHDDLYEDDDESEQDEDDEEDDEKREIIKLSSDEEDSAYLHNMDDIIHAQWSQEALSKLRHFIRYFDFAKMKHPFFREYVQSVNGLLSKDEIIGVFETHCDDMIGAMKAMENVIELQRYDSNYDNTRNLNTKRYKLQMYKTKEICYHSQEIDLEIMDAKYLTHKQQEYPSVPSYNYMELKSFIEDNIKSLFLDENEEKDDPFCDVIFEVGKDTKCHGIRALFAIHSPVFKSMLYGNMLESQSSNNVILEDMTKDIFNCLRSCFYGFTPVITYKNVIGLFYHSDKYLITPLKQSCMQYVNDINVSQQIDAFLYILSELQAYSLCSIWKSVISDMMKTIDIHNSEHIAQFIQILIKLHECELHQSWRSTIRNMNIKQSITCQKILFDTEFIKLPKIVTHQFIKTFRFKYKQLINQEELWTAVVSWATAQDLDDDNNEEDDVYSEHAKQLINEFVDYFDFTKIEAEFVREFVESVGVLTDRQRITIYRSHSIQLTDLQKRINELELANKQHQQQNQHYQNRLKGTERNIRQLKKLHNNELSQMRSQFNTDHSMNNQLYLQHRRQSTSAAVAQSYNANINDVHHVKSVRFDCYSREYLAISKNGKQIATKRDDCAWLLSYLNIKCSEGVHIFSIKAHECEHGYDAIGVISVKDMSFLTGKHFPDNKFGSQYYYHPAQHSWSCGETITVLIDCISSRIVFEKNGTIVHKSEIEKNKIYYPVLQTCGCAGHRYEILEYKNIRSCISKKH